jgi:predicted Zn finger-like uncharacterized protein
MRPSILSEVTKEWIESIPKVINENGCWIPDKKSASNGYVQIWIGDKYLSLHRLVLSIYYNINYYDTKIVTRHGFKCDKACFFHEHLTPGTNSENEYDKVRDGQHHHANKTECPSCGSSYRIKITKTGPNRGKKRRWCPVCTHKDRY